MKVFKERVYAYVFYYEDGEEQVIEIRNPNVEEKRELIQMISGGLEDKNKKRESFELIEYMINKFTNLELTVSLKDIDMNEVTHEFLMVVKHLEIMLSEITKEILITTRLHLIKEQTKEQELLLVEEGKELSELRYKRKNPKKKKKAK